MNQKILSIAVIFNNNFVLLRKKPAGSPPYKETWYLFGAEAIPENPTFNLSNTLKKQAGIEIEIEKQIGQDTEIKPDENGIETEYTYLDYQCRYKGGILTPGPGIEKLEWVPLDNLKDYDLVPPSKKLFTKLGYM